MRREYDRADTAIRDARRLYDLLGQTAALGRLRGDEPLKSQPTVVIRIGAGTSNSETMNVQVQLPVREMEHGALEPPRSPTIAEVLKDGAGELVSERFVRSFAADWRGVGAALSDAVLAVAAQHFLETYRGPEALRPTCASKSTTLDWQPCRGSS